MIWENRFRIDFKSRTKKGKESGRYSVEGILKLMGFWTAHLFAAWLWICLVQLRGSCSYGLRRRRWTTQMRQASHEKKHQPTFSLPSFSPSPSCLLPFSSLNIHRDSLYAYGTIRYMILTKIVSTNLCFTFSSIAEAMGYSGWCHISELENWKGGLCNFNFSIEKKKTNKSTCC